MRLANKSRSNVYFRTGDVLVVLHSRRNLNGTHGVLAASVRGSLGRDPLGNARFIAGNSGRSVLFKFRGLKRGQYPAGKILLPSSVTARRVTPGVYRGMRTSRGTLTLR